MATATAELTDRFIVRPAARRAVPQLISLSGTSGSGKTFSGLLLAAGLAGPKGRVGMIDAENGRGEIYADDPDIRAALADGYEYTQISAPYHPRRYTAAIKAQEDAGVTVCIIDSTSHEWEGEGGCCDIAENNKLRGMPNWAMAKLAHKRFLGYCLSSQMHIIFCLRAREKVKIQKDANGKEQILPIGIQPVAEKSFVFEMLLSLQFEESTHFASPIKVPKMLTDMFPGGRLITKADGERIRIWNETGAAVDANELLRKRSTAAALGGMKEYMAFFGTLTPGQKKLLVDSVHAENKLAAERADMESAASDGISDQIGNLQDLAEFPDPMSHEAGTPVKVNGKIYISNSGQTAWVEYERETHGQPTAV